MADLMAAGGATGPNENGAMFAAPQPPTAAPAPSNTPPGMRTPRVIMQERAAREARLKAEAERQQLARNRAEQEARLIEEAQRQQANRERRTAGVVGGHNSTTITNQPLDQYGQGQDPSIPQAPRAPVTATQQQQQSPPRQRQTQPGQRLGASQETSQAFGNAAGPRDTHQQPPPRQSQTQGPDTNIRVDEKTHLVDAKPRNSFPHAFERWETLSAHWEGLTSYWIRKLEQNKDDVNRDPISQQLARQVTDLSAAGANLFHAVVELQRLRASSERKFQRWFFETRSELERSQEVNAMLEGALEKERRDRADAIRDAVDHERTTSKAQKQLSEMRKELAISKEEARRAWEELGRREQEERDRTFSLQSGQPTIVGGVQVVPMSQGMPARHGSSRDQASYGAEYGQSYSAEQSQVPSTQPTPPTATSSVGYHRSSETAGPSQPQPPHGGHKGGYSGGEYAVDERGHSNPDAHRHNVPTAAAPPSPFSASDPEADEYETPATTNPPSGGYEPPSTSAEERQYAGTDVSPVDYSGEGYGAGSWEPAARHHHPTRLSDVIEEDDERSRTSASQRSRGP